jgi:hypothetical protein
LKRERIQERVLTKEYTKNYFNKYNILIMGKYTIEHIQEHLDMPNWMKENIVMHRNIMNCLFANTDKLTESLNKNSESSDNLTKVWHWLTWAIIFLWVIQIWIVIYKLFNPNF